MSENIAVGFTRSPNGTSRKRLFHQVHQWLETALVSFNFRYPRNRRMGVVFANGARFILVIHIKVRLPPATLHQTVNLKSSCSAFFETCDTNLNTLSPTGCLRGVNIIFNLLGEMSLCLVDYAKTSKVALLVLDESEKLL